MQILPAPQLSTKLSAPEALPGAFGCTSEGFANLAPSLEAQKPLLTAWARDLENFASLAAQGGWTGYSDDSTAHFCQWTGVICNCSASQVLSNGLATFLTLDFVGAGLQGWLPKLGCAHWCVAPV